jgi:isoleucyl-tRNA synthetase
MFKDVNNKVLFPKLEEEILAYWKKNKIFERSVRERTKKEYTFYDGPPFATGMPHYGHILAGVIKDVIPRYWTMKGYKVERRWGWDCHGLPVEHEREKELGISGKKDIEAMGIANFNESCRSIVQRYAEEWKKVVERTGRWVDMDNDYKTMDTSYMETIWWMFKQLWDKGLIYEGEKVVPYCYRCSTPLSNFEATQGYQDKQDTTLTVKFKLKDEDVYILAWTTTPWTLPSNLALAVSPQIDYVKIQDTNGEVYILAQSRLSSYYKNGGDYTILETFKGEILKGKKYEPLFPYFQDQKDAFKILTADFVTTEDGTGIVHIAPAYGEDDYQVCKENNITLVNPVDETGCFTSAVPDFVGRNVHEANKDIVHFLKAQGKVVHQDTIQHSYPFCWRCDTPLIYKAIPTWFVQVTKLKKKMMKNNDKIYWMPESVKYGRFGTWLENARDWAISRNRYWGSAMPVWKCNTCKHYESLGSLEDLYQKVPERMTKLILVRHGESEKNIKHIDWSQDDGYPLTEKGKQQVRHLSSSLPVCDVLLTSPVLRARQTADLISQHLGIEPRIEEDLREIKKGYWEGKNLDKKVIQEKEYYRQLSPEERYRYKQGGGESYVDVENRLQTFLQNIFASYRGKTVMIVGHKGPLRMIEKIVKQWSLQKFYSMLSGSQSYQVRTVYIDNHTQREFDLHKHIVDEISFPCTQQGCTGTMKRISEVLDCWFESGSMPYAQVHYPFENKEWFERNFPADFIAEGQDQTRGWFYTLIVLSSALFDKPAFKNVIVNGIVLAEDGKKMSKRLKNYPDPVYMLETYGADAMRFYLMSSPAVQAQDLRFSEKGVDEVVKSVLLPFWNAYTFFVTYANIDQFTGKRLAKKFNDKRDLWILSELQATIEMVTEKLDRYDLAGATGPITKFLDNLTNWYIRRSRRRFWKSENDTDKQCAYSALYIVLTTLARLLAPYTPFIAEEIYRNLTGEESVHLASWPKVKKSWYNKELNLESAMARTIVTLGLSARAKNKIKVRQPLSRIELVVPPAYQQVIKEYEDIIREELNVKEVQFLEDSETIAQKIAKPIGAKIGPRFGNDAKEIFRNAKKGRFKEVTEGDGRKIVVFDEQGKEWILNTDEVEIGYEGKEGFDVLSDQGIVVALDVHVTEELRQEGIARDIIRTIQDMRKEAGYHVSDRIMIALSHCPADVLKHFGSYIQQETLSQLKDDLSVFDQERLLEIENEKIIIRIKK